MELKAVNSVKCGIIIGYTSSTHLRMLHSLFRFTFSRFLLTFTFLLLNFLSCHLFAQITWDGDAGTTAWSDGANWNPDGVPGDADDVVIDGDFTVVVSTSDSCRSIQLIPQNASNRDANLIVTNGARLGVGTDVNMDDRDRTGNSCIIDVDGGAVLFVAGDLYMTKDNGSSNNNDMLLRIAGDDSRVLVGDDVIANFSINNNNSNDMGFILTEDAGLEADDINITLGGSQEANTLISMNAAGAAGDSSYIAVTNDLSITNNSGSMDCVIDMDFEATFDIGNSIIYSATAGEGFYWYMDRDVVVNVGEDINITKDGNEELYIYLNQNDAGAANDVQITVGDQIAINKTDGDDFFFLLSEDANVTAGGDILINTSNEDDNGDDVVVTLNDNASISTSDNLRFTLNDGSQVDLFIQLNDASAVTITNEFSVNQTNAHFFELELNNATAFAVGTDFIFENTTSSHIPVVDMDHTSTLTIGEDLIWTDNNTESDNISGFYLDRDAAITVGDTFLIDKNTDGHLYVNLNQTADGSANDAQITASNFLIDKNSGDDIYFYLSNHADIIVSGNIQVNTANQDGNDDDVQIILNDDATLTAGVDFEATLNDASRVDLFMQLNDNSSITATTGHFSVDQIDATLFELEMNGASALTVGTYFQFDNTTSSSIAVLDMDNTAAISVGSDFYWTDDNTDNGSLAGLFLDRDASISVTDSMVLTKNTDGHFSIHLNQISDGGASDAQITASNLIISQTTGDDLYFYASDDADVIITGDVTISATNQDGNEDDIRIIFGDDAGLTIGGDLEISYDDDNEVDVFMQLNNRAAFNVTNSFSVTQNNAHFFELEMNNSSSFSIGNDFVFSNTTTSHVPIIDMDNTATLNIGGDLFWTDNNTIDDGTSGFFLDTDASMTITDTFQVIKPTDGHFYVYLNQTTDGSGSDAQLACGALLMDFDNTDRTYIRLSNNADLTVTNDWIVTADDNAQGDHWQIQMSGDAGIDVNGNASFTVNSVNDNVDIDLNLTSDGAFDIAGDFTLSNTADDTDIEMSNGQSLIVGGDWTATLADADNFDLDMLNTASIAVNGDVSITNTSNCDRIVIDMDNTNTFSVGQDFLIDNNSDDDAEGETRITLDRDAAMTVGDSLFISDSDDDQVLIQLNQNTDGAAADAQLSVGYFVISKNQGDEVQIRLANDADLIVTNDFLLDIDDIDLDNNVSFRLADAAGADINGNMTIDIDNQPVNLDLIVDLTSSGSLDVAGNVTINLTGDNLDINMSGSHSFVVGGNYNATLSDADIYDVDMVNSSSIAVTGDYTVTNDASGLRIRHDLDNTTSITIGQDMIINNLSASGTDGETNFSLDADASLTVSDSLFITHQQDDEVLFYMNQTTAGAGADVQVSVNYFVIEKDMGDGLFILLDEDADLTVTNNILINSNDQEDADPVRFRLEGASGIDVNGDVTVNITSPFLVDFDLDHYSSGDLDVANDFLVTSNGDDFTVDLTGTGDWIIGDSLSFSLTDGDNFDINMSSSSAINVGNDWTNSLLNSDNFTLNMNTNATVAVTDRFTFVNNAGSDLVEIDLDNDAAFSAADMMISQNSATTALNNGIFIDSDATITITDSLYWVQPTEGNCLMYLNQNVDGAAADAQFSVGSITFDKDLGDLLSVRLSQGADITVTNNFTIDGDNFENSDHAEIRLSNQAGIDINGSLLFSNLSTLDNDVRIYHSSSGNLDIANDMDIDASGDDIDFDITGTGDILVGGNVTMDMPSGDNIELLFNNDGDFSIGGDWTTNMAQADNFDLEIISTASVAVTDRFSFANDASCNLVQFDMDNTAAFSSVDFIVNHGGNNGVTNGIFLDRDATLTITDSIFWTQSRNGNLQFHLNQSADGAGADAQITASAFVIDKDSGDITRIRLGNNSDVIITNNLEINSDDQNASQVVSIELEEQSGLDVNGDVLVDVSSPNAGVDIDFISSSSGDFDIAGDFIATIPEGDDFDVDMTGTGDWLVGGVMNVTLGDADIIDFDLTSSAAINVTGDVTLRNTNTNSRRIRIDLDNTSSFTTGQDLVIYNATSDPSDSETLLVLDRDATMTVADSIFITHDGNDEVRIDLNTAATGSGADAQLSASTIYIDKDNGADTRVRVFGDGDLTVANNLEIDSDDQSASEVIEIDLRDQGGFDINGDFLVALTSPNAGVDLNVRHSSSGDLDIAGDFTATIAEGDDFDANLSGNGNWIVGGNFSVLVDDADIIDFDLTNSFGVNVTGDMTLRNSNTNARRVRIDMDNTSTFNVGQDLVMYNETTDNSNSESLITMDRDAAMTVGDSLFITHNGNDDLRIELNQNADGAANDAQLSVAYFVLDFDGGDEFELQLSNDADLLVSQDMNINYGTSESSNDDFLVQLRNDATVVVQGSALLEYDNGFSTNVNDFTFDLNDNTQFVVGPSGGPFNTESFTMQMSQGEDIVARLDDAAQLIVYGDWNIIKSGGDDINIQLNDGAGTTAQINVLGNVDIDNTENADLIFIELNQNALFDIGGDLDMQGIASENQLQIELENSSEVELTGNFLQNAAPNNFGTFDMNGTSLLELNATTEQQVLPPDDGGGADFFDYQNVLLNNSFATVPQLTTGGDVTIHDNLDFTDGVLYASTDSLIIVDNDATVTNASDASHTNGPVRKVGDDVFTFPVGNGEQYRLCGITAPSQTTDIFTATYLDQNPWPLFPGGTREPSIDHISSREYWDIDQDNGSSSVRVTLSWDTNSGGVTDLSELVVAHWNVNIWEDEGNVLTLGSTVTGTIQSQDFISSFSPFTLGSTTMNNPLPIELLTFEASKKSEEAVLLEWSTASETNNDFFELEKSVDGVAFETIGQVQGAGNSSRKLEYDFVDNAPVEGWNYYRLRQVDFDGTSTYSEIRQLLFEPGNKNSKIVVWPNPVREKMFSIACEDFDLAETNVRLVDITGRPVSIQARPAGHGFNVEIIGIIDAGYYLLVIQSAHQQEVKRIAVN